MGKSFWEKLFWKMKNDPLNSFLFGCSFICLNSKDENKKNPLFFSIFLFSVFSYAIVRALSEVRLSSLLLSMGLADWGRLWLDR
jgi:hypothetical protein